LRHSKDLHYEWNEVKRDLEALREVELEMQKESFFIRTELRGVCHDVFQAVGVAVPRRIRK
jgi:hypothetical protein